MKCLLSILSVIIVFQWSNFRAMAITIEEIHELRLANAELALVEGNDKRALQYIKKNLHSKYFHENTYLFLAKYYSDRGNFTKTLRIYYYIIKKKHTRSLIEEENIKLLKKRFSLVSPPSKKIMGIYFKIATLYYNYHGESIFSYDYKQKLLALADKYFLICQHYKYEVQQSTYFRGIIARGRNKHAKAIDHLMDTKEETLKEEKTNTEQIDNIDVLLADSHFNVGNFDAGTIYLKSIYHSRTANKSLREYADNYLNTITTKFFSLTVSYSGNYNSNVHELSDADYDDFDNNQTLQSTYHSTDSYSKTKKVNLYYSSARYKYWSFVVTLDGSEELHNKREIGIEDSRSFTAGFECKYDNLLKSIGKISYSFSQAYNKKYVGAKFDTEYQAHSISPKYIHTLKSGIISYGIPFTVIKYKILRNSIQSYGISVSYTPFAYSKYLAPTFSQEFTRQEETEGYEDSNQSSTSISNHLSFSNSLGLFLYLNLFIKKNSESTLAYNEYTLSGYMTYLVPVISGLSLNLSISKNIRDIDDGTEMNKWTGSLGLSYTF